eukprot:gene21310-28241_t
MAIFHFDPKIGLPPNLDTYHLHASMRMSREKDSRMINLFVRFYPLALKGATPALESVISCSSVGKAAPPPPGWKRVHSDALKSDAEIGSRFSSAVGGGLEANVAAANVYAGTPNSGFRNLLRAFVRCNGDHAS